MATPQVLSGGAAAPKSTHVSDDSLKPFIKSAFDPAEFLNATLPPLALSVSGSAKGQSSVASVSLSDLSSQTQTLLAQLNAQTSRLSTVLTQLTDDILRSGGRLAYEVEVLRGEAIGLSEVLTDGLHSDLNQFILDGRGSGETVVNATAESKEPTFITQLRTLTQVRARLESVIKVFGEAMQWTLPPSEVSLTSSLISVSAPEPGLDSQSREEKGREFSEKLRTEIADLITGSGREEDGYDAAMSRISALRDLAQLWKGTAEEKARIKFVDGLVRLAEEHQKASKRDVGGQRPEYGRTGAPRKATGPEKGKGFLENLRDSIYLE